MRIPFFIYMLLSVSTSSAYTMTCDIVSINGETPIKPASLSFNNDETLLEINRGNGPEKLLQVIRYISLTPMRFGLIESLIANINKKT